MKKIVLSFMLILSLTAMSLSFSGCSEKEGVIFLSKGTLCHYTEMGYKFSFNLLYLYTGNQPEISFVSFGEVSLDKAFLEMKSKKEEAFGESKNGYRLGYLSIYLNHEVTQSVTKVELLLNGNPVTVNFDNALVAEMAERAGRYDCMKDIRVLKAPFTVNYGGLSMEGMDYSFQAQKDLTITSFGYSDYWDITDADVYVGGKMVGKLKDVLPLSIHAGESLTVRIQHATIPDDYLYADLMVNVSLLYTVDEEFDVQKEYIDPNYFLGITNEQEYAKFIDYYFEGEKQ